MAKLSRPRRSPSAHIGYEDSAAIEVTTEQTLRNRLFPARRTSFRGKMKRKSGRNRGGEIDRERTTGGKCVIGSAHQADNAYSGLTAINRVEWTLVPGQAFHSNPAAVARIAVGDTFSLHRCSLCGCRNELGPARAAAPNKSAYYIRKASSQLQTRGRLNGWMPPKSSTGPPLSSASSDCSIRNHYRIMMSALFPARTAPIRISSWISACRRLGPGCGVRPTIAQKH